MYGYVGNMPILWKDPLGLDATSWYGDGRGTTDGPKNGNWGGKNWSGGQNPQKHDGQDGTAPPTDSADEAYKRHDNCYSACEGKSKVPYPHQCGRSPYSECIAKCDKQLVDDLKALPKDSHKWPKPPRPGTEKDSEDFRDDAIWYFGK